MPRPLIRNGQQPWFFTVLCGLSLGLFLARSVIESVLDWLPGPGWAAIIVVLSTAAAVLTFIGRRRFRLSPLLLLLLYAFYPRVYPPAAWVVGAVAIIALVHLNAPRRVRYTWDALVLLSGLGLYVHTLAPDVLPADSGEFQFVSFVLGIAHPPGYPLYTLLGKAFTWLPWGNVAYRVNLFAAVTGALTLMVVNCTVRENTASSLAGWLAAVLLGTAPTFWAQSTTANIRSLTAFFAAVQIAACLGYARTKAGHYLDAFALAFGLGVTHHSSNLPLVLPYITFLVACDPSLLRRRSSWRRPLGLFAVSCFVLLYLPVRSALGAPFDPAPIRSVSGLLEHVLALGFRGDMFYFIQPAALVSRASVLLNILRLQFGVAGLWLMVVGALAAWWRQRKLLLLCGAVFGVNALLAITYRAPQTVEYMMPGYVALACVGASGVWSLAGVLLKGEGSSLILAAAFALPLVTLQSGYPSFRMMSQDHSTREYAETLLRQAPEGAEVLSNWHYATALWYLQYAESQRLDVTVTYVYPEGVTPNAQVWLRRIESNRGLRPTVLTNYFPEFASAPYVFQPLAGAWLAELQAGESIPAPAEPLDATFDGLIELFGYDLDRDSVSPTETIRVRVYWRPVVQLQRDYSFFIHLLDESGAILGQGDINHPASQYAPGRVVVNEYDIPLLPTARPGKHRLIAGIYITLAEGGWQRLPIEDGQDAVQVAEVDVTPLELAPATAHPLLQPSDSGWILCGVDYDHSVAEQFRVYLHWRSGKDVTLAHQMVLESSQELQTQSHLPSLPAGAHLTTAHDLPAGQRGLTLELKNGVTGTGYEWRGPWQLPVGDRMPLPEPTQEERYVPFGGDMVLLGAGYPSQARPGLATVATVILMGARPIVRDYAISMGVHAESGDWRTQHDGTPAMGAIPTLKWIRGTVVKDEHTIPMPMEAGGRGVMRLTIYDSFNLQPLPVLDERLARVGQGTYVALGTLEITP